MGFSFAIKAQTIWNTGSLVFSQTAAGQFDAITNQTHLGRTSVIHNLVCQSVSGLQDCNFNPCNTQWAEGSIANWNTLSYNNLYTLNLCNPPSMVGKTYVCRLITENIYLQVKFNSWTSQSPYFTYTRTINAVLPVIISKFTGKKTGNNNVLTWTSSTENNNSHYNVQRSSNGNIFENLNKIDTKAFNGNSSVNIDYNHTDIHPIAGYNYYRLEQVDKDARKYYSPVIKVSVNNDISTYSIVQNPTNNLLKLNIVAASSYNCTVKLFDIYGRVIKTITTNMDKGDNTIKIPLFNLNHGLYIIQVYENGILAFTEKVLR